MAKVQVNIQEAETQLSQLIDRALAGDEVIIARDGAVVAELRPTPTNDTPKRERPFGIARGQIWIAPDFDDYDEEIQRLFEGPEDEVW